MNGREIVGEVCRLARAPKFAFVVTPNVDHVIKLESDGPLTPLLRAAYANADLRVCDSRILLKLASLSNISMGFLPGSDLTRNLVEAAIPSGSSVALVGGNSAQLRFLAALRPDVDFRQHCPPMGVMRDPAAQLAIAEFVEAQRCDFVLFTIGAPQSELVAHLIKVRGRARGVGLCVGAAVEFITGEKRRAPEWVQRAMLEWAHRLLSEPGRLWRRYLVDGPRIFSIWWSQRRPIRARADDAFVPIAVVGREHL